MLTLISASRIPSKLASALVLALMPLCVWSQEGEWNKRMKAGERALGSFQPNKFAKAEKEFQATLAQTQVFPDPDLRTAETLGKLAEANAGVGNFNAAEDFLKRDAAVTEAVVGADDPRLASVLIRLALADERGNKSYDAAPLWIRSLAILKHAAKPVDPSLLEAMDKASMSGWSNLEAEEHICSAILELRESLGASELELQRALVSMANVDERANRFAQAEPLRLRILKIDERKFGPESHIVGNDVEQLAGIYTSEGKYDAALPLLQRRLEITTKENQPDTPSTRRRKDLETGLNVAMLIPQLPLAILAEGPVLPLLPVDRPSPREILLSCKALAKGYANAGRFPEAEEMYKQIVATEGKETNSNQSNRSGFLFNDLMDFAKVYRGDHRYGDALATIRQAGALSQQTEDSRFETRHANLAGPSLYPWLAQIELAETYREMGDTAAAGPAFEKSLQMADDLKKLWPGHPRLAEMLSNYATLLRDEGKYEQSEALYDRSLDSWSKSRNPPPAELAGTLMNFAALLRTLDRSGEAEAMEARASDILPKTLQ